METVFLSLSKSDFEDLLAGIVSSCLRHNPHTAPQQQAKDELLTVKDAAKFLSLSVPTIYGLIHKGEIPVMKRSKRCYFSKEELINYLKQGRKKTLSEIDTETDAFLSNRKRKEVSLA